MRKKLYKTLACTFAFVLAANITAFAGSWRQNENGQWVELSEGQDTSGSVHHNDEYDPAYPLKNMVEAWDLEITDTKYDDYIVGNNVHAMLTGQMDQYFAPPVGEYVDAIGNHIYTEQADYDEARNTENVLYNWFCNWLNNMNFENMTEIERAKEVQKVLAEAQYDSSNASNSTEGTFEHILIDKKGYCAEFALTACSLARALGLKCEISGTGNHAVYYIQVDGTAYFGQNNILNLNVPTPDYVNFRGNQK